MINLDDEDVQTVSSSQAASEILELIDTNLVPMSTAGESKVSSI